MYITFVVQRGKCVRIRKSKPSEYYSFFASLNLHVKMVSSLPPEVCGFKIRAQPLTALSIEEERLWSLCNLELNHRYDFFDPAAFAREVYFCYFLQLFPGIFYCRSQTYASSMVLQFIFVFLQGNHSSME